tara:strand:+ start:473 stop:682 length:210 start_codon:yes stop_codon:yes gene_type:complete
MRTFANSTSHNNVKSQYDRTDNWIAWRSKKSYIDAKTGVKITEAKFKKKQLMGEIDCEQSVIEASKNSF